MKRFLMVCAAAAGFIALGIGTSAIGTGAGTAHAAEATVSADVMTNYVWRGQKLSADRGVVQPSLDISRGALGFNYWANYNLETGDADETDFTVSYTREIDKITVGAGYIYYALVGDDTQEFYISAAYDALLSPSLTLYYDFELGDGAFLVASVGHTVAMPGGHTVDLGASVGVNLHNGVMGTGTDGNKFTGLYNGELTASMTVAEYRGVAITPKVAWSFALGDDAELTAKDSIIYGGVGLSASF